MSFMDCCVFFLDQGLLLNVNKSHYDPVLHFIFLPSHGGISTRDWPTAMRSLDQGSLYYGVAVVVPQNIGTAAATIASAWGATGFLKDGGTIAAQENPWKKAVIQEPDGRES